jgi:hypothetical protein
MIYLFYYFQKKLNKTNSQTRSLKVKNDNFLYAREMQGKEVEDEPRHHEGIHQLLVAATIITRVTTPQP